MPAGKTTSQSDQVLNLMRGSNATAFTPYVGLLSTAPANDGATGTELTGNGYARQAVTFGAPADDSGAGRKVSNTNVVRFGPATSNWLAAVAFGIYDAETGGTLRYWSTITSVTVNNTASLEVAVAQLNVGED